MYHSRRKWKRRAFLRCLGGGTALLASGGALIAGGGCGGGKNDAFSNLPPGAKPGGGGPGNGGGGGDAPSPKDRARTVMAMLRTLVPPEKRRQLFGNQTDAVEAAIEQQLARAFQEEDAFFAGAPGVGGRNQGDPPSTPGPEAWTGGFPVSIPPIPTGDFQVAIDVEIKKYHENAQIGGRGKFAVTVTGKLLGIDVHATLKLDVDTHTEYCPGVNGTIAGGTDTALTFDGTISEPGFHSIHAALAAVRTFTGFVRDDAELGTVDGRSNYHAEYSFDGQPMTNFDWSGTIQNASGAAGGGSGTQTVALPPNIDTAQGSFDAKALRFLSEETNALHSIIEIWHLFPGAKAIWQGGHCIQVDHTDQEVHDRDLRPGETFEVVLQTLHRVDNSTVQNVRYTPSLGEPHVKQTSAGRFQLTVPNDTEQARNLFSKIVWTATSKRGKAQISIGFSLGRLRLDRIEIREGKGSSELVLTGRFGDAGGTEQRTVTVGGTEVTVTSWSDTEIRCQIPASGPGSAGDVQVANGFGVNRKESNRLQLTSWRGQITYTLAAAGSLQQSVTLDVHLRAGLNTPVLQRLDPASDSTGSYQASGRYVTTVEKCTYTYLWSGSGALPVTDAPAPGSNFVYFQGLLDPARKVLSFKMGGSAPTGLTQTTITECPPDAPKTDTFPGQLIDTGFLSDLQNATGQIEMSLDGQYNVAAGSRTTSVSYSVITGQEQAKVTISWTAMAAEFPPR